MANKDSHQGLFKRHKIFSLIFGSLFLALLLASVAVVQQRQVLQSKAWGGGISIGCVLDCHPGDKQCEDEGGKCVQPDSAFNCPGGHYESNKCEGAKNRRCCKGSKNPGGTGVIPRSGPAAGPGSTSNGVPCGKENTRCCDKTPKCNSGLGCIQTSAGTVCKKGFENGVPCGKENQRCCGTSCNLSTLKCIQTSAGTACVPNGKDGGGAAPAPAGKAPSGGGTGGGGGAAPAAPAQPAPAAKSPTTAPVTGNVTLNLKLKFQGITSQPASQFNSMKVKVSLSDTVSTTGDFTADTNGIWSGKVSFTNVPIGTPLSIFVKGPKHLQKRICVANPTETKGGTFTCQNGTITLVAGDNNLNFSNIILLAGDLPDPQQDGVVDSSDISFLRQHLTSTDSNDLVIGDLNLDGVITTQDYSLAIAALSIKTDDAVK